MNEEITIPPSRDEARATLADIESILVRTRRTIAEGWVAPVLILWGVLWMVAYGLAQFWPMPHWSWIPIDCIGFGGMWWLGVRRRAPIKRPVNWRAWGFWLLLFAYAFMWMQLLMPWGLLEHLPPGDDALLSRKMTAYAATIPMFGFVILGMWAGRFFVWLGLLVTVLILIGYRYSGDYFNLWMAITGGGALILSGVFIRKFWK